MADAKISALTELAATPAADDYLPIVDASEVTDGSKNKRITVDNLFAYNTNIVFVPLTTPLTSTSWDGDSFSTTGKTLMDLSAEFGAPAGIKAILAKVTARDSGSAGATMLYFGISSIETSAVSPVVAWVAGTTNDSYQGQCGICPCDANGDIYYEIKASGTNTMDCWFEIWGYWL